MRLSQHVHASEALVHNGRMRNRIEQLRMLGRIESGDGMTRTHDISPVIENRIAERLAQRRFGCRDLQHLMTYIVKLHHARPKTPERLAYARLSRSYSAD